MRGLVIAGTNSGIGKTTVATGIMAALKRRGLRVQPFKVGPDYIDPSHHTVACGVPSRNLDTWLMEPPVVMELFRRALSEKDVAVVEGVMGLYDGFRGDDEQGSTAEVAKLLHLPVILVVDVSRAARSVGATILGFKVFDAELNIAGVILNGIAGESHLESIKASLVRSGIPVVGYLPTKHDLALPERYLGLVPTMERMVAAEFYARLADQLEQTIDLDRILSISLVKPVAPQATGIFPDTLIAPRVTIAVAMDRAFNFYYADSLDLLSAWGAQIVPFSPLNDIKVPSDADAIYIGGGFPELYARELAENEPMLCSLRKAASSDLPIYAECGGLMYLGQSIENREGRRHQMVGVLPMNSLMENTRLTLGYRTVRAINDNLFMTAGEQVRGHEFHLSALREKPDTRTAVYEMMGLNGRVEGFRVNNVVASYVHLHLASKSSLAPRFVNVCASLKSARVNSIG